MLRKKERTHRKNNPLRLPAAQEKSLRHLEKHVQRVNFFPPATIKSLFNSWKGFFSAYKFTFFVSAFPHLPLIHDK